MMTLQTHLRTVSTSMAWLATSETHITSSSINTLVFFVTLLARGLVWALLKIPWGLGPDVLFLLPSLNFGTKALVEDKARTEDFGKTEIDSHPLT